MRALRLGALVVVLGSLLSACSAANEGSPDDGSDLGPGSGGFGIVPPSTGGAGSIPVATGGAYASGGAYGTGGVVGTGGSYGTGGVVGTGGAPVYGTGGVPPVGTGGVPAGTGGSPAANVVCNPIANGLSSLTVDGIQRVFDVQMPANTSHMALLFVWHGWMQVPAEFTNEIVYDVGAGHWVPFDPNAFPMPLMIVSPHDTKLLPPLGLDWDIVSGAKDFPFFEGMLDCIQEQFSIDTNRIYSFGFSAGAVFTNLLTAAYPHLFAATISESGAWFNDQTQWSDVSIPIITWQWPAFNPADGGNVLLTHGGPQDFATVISLESTNQKALPYLYNNGRTVTECIHDFGHTLDPDLTQAMYYEYMWAHTLGGPPLEAMPAGFPTQGNPVGRTSCVFHPHP